MSKTQHVSVGPIVDNLVRWPRSSVNALLDVEHKIDQLGVTSTADVRVYTMIVGKHTRSSFL